MDREVGIELSDELNSGMKSVYKYVHLNMLPKYPPTTGCDLMEQSSLLVVLLLLLAAFFY